MSCADYKGFRVMVYIFLMLDEIPFNSKHKDVKCTLWFEFSIVNEWMHSKLCTKVSLQNRFP